MLRYLIYISLLLMLSSANAQPFIVWPGDTNNDGVVNQLDIIPLGYSFFTTGPPRVGATTNWVAQPSNIWSGTLPSSNVNYTYIDADGNGVIEFADRDVVALNYDSLQNPNTGNPYILPDTLHVVQPPVFSFSFGVDSVKAGDPLLVSIKMDALTTALPYAYSVAFSVMYDKHLVNDTMTVARMPDSFLGNSANSVFIGAAPFNVMTGRFIIEEGEADFGKTGTDGNNKTGDGEIASLSIVTVEDILKREAGDEQLHFEFKDILVLDNQERVIASVTSVSDSIKVYDLITSIETPSEDLISVFPNPSKSIIQLDISKNLSMGTLSIHNVKGKIVWSANLVSFNDRQPIDVSHLHNGLYVLSLENKDFVATKKLIILR